MEATIVNVSRSIHKSPRIEKVNSVVLVISVIILLIVSVLYFPIPSYNVRGHIWEPDLDIRTHWPYLLILIGIFLFSCGIMYWNKTREYGTVDIDDKSIRITFDKTTNSYNFNEIDLVELTGEELYIRSNKQSYNLSITNIMDFSSLITALKLLGQHTKVEIRDNTTQP